MTSADHPGLPELEHALDDGWTLPAPGIPTRPSLAQERERLFARTWQYAGWTDQVSEPG